MLPYALNQPIEKFAISFDNLDRKRLPTGVIPKSTSEPDRPRPAPRARRPGSHRRPRSNRSDLLDHPDDPQRERGSLAGLTLRLFQEAHRSEQFRPTQRFRRSAQPGELAAGGMNPVARRRPGSRSASWPTHGPLRSARSLSTSRLRTGLVRRRQHRGGMSAGPTRKPTTSARRLGVSTPATDIGGGWVVESTARPSSYRSGCTHRLKMHTLEEGAEFCSNIRETSLTESRRSLPQLATAAKVTPPPRRVNQHPARADEFDFGKRSRRSRPW